MAKSLAGRPSRKSATKPHFTFLSLEKLDYLSISVMNPSDRILYEKRKEKLQKILSAESLTEILEAVRDLEPLVEESFVGVWFWILAKKLQEEEYDDANTVFYFADKALRIMVCNNISSYSIPIAELLQVLAFACVKLNRLDKSLKYLNWAVRKLENMEYNGLVLLNLNKFYLQLCDLKHSMGTNEGCISYMLKNLVITEKIWGKHSRELAEANLGVFNLYLIEMRYREAIPFCLNALAIYLTCSGHNTEKIAECSDYLGGVYQLIGENETAFEHNRLSQKLWKNLGCVSLLIMAEIDGAYLLSELGRSEEAVQSLREIIPRTEENSKERTDALTCLAEAYIKQEKFAEARECAEIACGILGDKESSFSNDPLAFSNVAKVYTELCELEIALSLLRKAQAIMQAEQEIPISTWNKSLKEVSEKIVALLLEIGEFEEAIPYLEVDVETTKMSFGLKHLKVGEVYDKLGYAYLHTNKLHLSVQAFGCAKDIFDESLGPLHDDSIMTCKTLCTTYVAIGSYTLAITFLEEAIKRMEEVGPSAKEYLAEAAILLDELKEIASSGKDSQSGNISESTNISFQEKAMSRLKISKWKKNKVVKSSTQNVLESLEGLKISKDDENE